MFVYMKSVFLINREERDNLSINVDFFSKKKSQTSTMCDIYLTGRGTCLVIKYISIIF